MAEQASRQSRLITGRRTPLILVWAALADTASTHPSRWSQGTSEHVISEPVVDNPLAFYRALLYFHTQSFQIREGVPTNLESRVL